MTKLISLAGSCSQLSSVHQPQWKTEKTFNSKGFHTRLLCSLSARI